MRRPLHIVLLGVFSLAGAVFQDEVGVADFHHALLGVPQPETTFFHRPRQGDKASLLYTFGDVGVFGAVNPSNGDVVWRQEVAQGATRGAGHLRAAENENWVAAALGRRVHAWDALTGRNIWNMEFEGEVKDLEIMEITESSRKDVLALFDENGATVLRRMHGALGTVVWEFREISKDVPLQVSTNVANIFVISLHGSSGSYNVRSTTLDIVSGSRVDHTSIGSKGDIHEPSDIMFVGANSASPVMAWTDSKMSKLSIHVLGGKGKQDFTLPPETVSAHIHAPQLVQSQPHFLLHARTQSGNKAEVYHVNLKSNQVNKAFDLPHLPGNGAFSVSSSGANVYFTRITEDEVLIVNSDSHGILARWPFKPQDGVAPHHAVSEVIKKPGGEGYAVRSAATTTADDWIMITNGVQDWSRPEGLSGAVAAVWAEIPEAESLAKVLEQEAHTNPISAYLHRVQRHLDDLKYLPDYLASIPKNIMESIVDGDVSSDKSVHRDTFGFNKVIVLVTRRGRVYGLNSGNAGEVIWSKAVFPQDKEQSLDVKGIFAKDEEGHVVIRGSEGEYAAIEAVTGKIVEMLPAGSGEVVASTAVVDGAAGPWLLPVGTSGQAAIDIVADDVPKATVVVRTESGVLKGVKFAETKGKVSSHDVWQLQILPGQKIVDTATPPALDTVASIGRVLGDRGVQYKYLNPNTIVVAILEEAKSALTVQVVDTVSGEVLSSQLYDGVDGDQPISCAMAENWNVCTFFGQYIVNDGTDRSIKGYQLVATDLYETSASNDRGPLGDAANFSSLQPLDNPAGQPPRPWVVSQAYVLSQKITTLSVTQTRQSISNRQVLGYLPDSHAVVGITRQAIDPRRPVGRDPSAAEMEAEGLFKYGPAFEIDPRTLVSHEYDVIGVKNIVASPAIVESTSLVVAYGVDVFGSRVAPSGTFDILGKGFNKATLLATVAALLGGVIVLSPVVRRKQIDQRWTMPS